MEFPKREPALPQGSPRRSPKAMRAGAATEADENASPRRPVPAWGAPPLRTKVLGERNDGGVEANASPPAPQPKPAPSPPTLTGRGAGPYDPKTNYTTPRPAFLRYDPERRREILLRVARTAEVEYDDCSSTASGTAVSEDDGGSVASDAAAASPASSSARRSDSEAELDYSNEEVEEEEEEVAPARRGRWGRRLFLLLIAVACSFCYIKCMNPAAFPAYSEEEDLDFIGPVGGMYDADEHELDSLRLLGPVYMMGPEDVLEETTSQNVQQHNQDVVHLDDHRVSPRNSVAVTMMGLADICLNVPLGEFTCQIWGESSENVADLKEDSELDELETEVPIESFQNGEQSTGASCLGGSISLDSIGSTCTHTADMEEGGPGVVHQVEGNDHSDGFVLQLVSMVTTMKSASDKLNDSMGLESDDLNLWHYENTAEAAKAICSIVKFLWSAMEPHLFQILSCLSVAGMVAALFRYYQRSRQTAAPAPQHMTSKPLAEVPVLVPHQVVQLPELKVPNQGLQLSGRLEVPVEGPLPQPDPFVSCKDPVQESLPKTDLFVSPKVAMVDHGNRDQELQHGYADNIKAYNGNFLNHRDVDSSKPPVVTLLGEFKFANSSKERPLKSSNQYAGDAAVQEFSTLLRKDVDNMQMDSIIIQSPSVRRERKVENPVNGEKTDAMPAPVTPTPLRRSNRLRDKVTSP